MDTTTPVIMTMALVGFGAFMFGVFVASVSSKAAGKSGDPNTFSGGLALQEMRRLESKVDVLLKHFDLTSQAAAPVVHIDQNSDMPPEVMAYLPGKKIEAIKMYRTLKGVGLKEAKDKVDAACREMRF